jgi:hypothetical protein
MNARKEGVGHGVASSVGWFWIPYAAIEFSQVKKLVPGLNQSVAHTIAGKVRTSFCPGKEKLIEYGEQIGRKPRRKFCRPVVRGC